MKEKTSSMQREYETIKGGKVQDQTVGEIGGFVKKLGEKQGLELHSNLAERCLETTRGGAGASADDNSAFMRGLEVERMCVEGRDLDKILEHLRNLVHTSGDDPRRTARLLALASLTHGGIPAAKLEPVRIEMLRAYGSRVLAVLGAMEQCGWLATREDNPRTPGVSRDSQAAVAGGGRRRRPRPERRGVRVLAQRLRARVMQADPPRPHGLLSPHRRRPSSAPRAALRVHAGLRHARRFARRGRRRREVVPAAKGARGGGSGGRGGLTLPKPPRRGPGRRPTCVVFFVGGVTRAEISCLRFMSSSKMRLGVDFVVGATNVCGGFDLVEQAMGDVAASFPSLVRGGSNGAVGVSSRTGAEGRRGMGTRAATSRSPATTRRRRARSTPSSRPFPSGCEVR